MLKRLGEEIFFFFEKCSQVYGVHLFTSCQVKGPLTLIVHGVFEERYYIYHVPQTAGGGEVPR